MAYPFLVGITVDSGGEIWGSEYRISNPWVVWLCIYEKRMATAKVEIDDMVDGRIDYRIKRMVFLP